MAFSATQRAQIYQYLGYDAIGLDATLETKITGVESSGSAAEATVAGILTQITAVETSLSSSGASAARGALKRADDIEFYDTKSETSVFQAGLALTPLQYGRLLVSRLAVRLELDPDALPSDYFGRAPRYGAGVSTKASRGWNSCDD